MESLYAQAYCYLKTNDYSTSIEKFKSVIQYHSDVKIIYDSYMRIGDAYFLLMNYELSVYFYEKALKLSGFEDDYASYKKGTSYVLLVDYHNAIKSLNNLIQSYPNSNYVDDAIFDLGNVYILSRNFDLAINSFLKLIRDFPKSLFYSNSKLKLGLVYYLQEKDKKALDILNDVVLEFPNTQTANEALNIIQNIYNDSGQAGEFLKLIQNLNHDYTKSELDSSSYYSSELQYLQGNYNNAINAFESYLSYYPNGLFWLEANYFLYKSHESLGDLEAAIEILRSIVNDSEHKYTVDALFNLGRISYELGKFISSEEYFSKLSTIASEIAIKKKALLGLLESKFQLYKYNEIVDLISGLSKDGLFSGKDDLRIRYLHAVSLYKINRNKDSLSEFRWLLENTEGDLKAEAFYYTSLLLYHSGLYADSQKYIFQLLNELPTYKIWVEKSLLILAKNYIIQEDMFQGQHVLLELQKQAQNQDVLEESRNMLMHYFPIIPSDSLIKKK